MIVKYKSAAKTHCVVNANDIIFDSEMRERLKSAAGEVDILLCGYTGAGPYPQTYFDVSDPKIKEEADKKKEAFFLRYKTLVGHIDAKVNIPFAGKYVLGGKLAHLNKYRGVADPVEALSFDKKSVVLADNGGEISTYDLLPTGIRTEKYNEDDVDRRIQEVSIKKMDYERLISFDEIHQLPLRRLLLSGAKNAKGKSECKEDYFFCIHLPAGEYAVINANREAQDVIKYISKKEELPHPRSEVYIDPRYLFGLLTHVYHWNNAEVGSQYGVRRVPNIFNRQAQCFLNFLAI
jgi:UDP-MurNAc hydroxylase